MSKSLVAYFSATGTTRRLAKTLAEAVGGDLYEIKPLRPYTNQDLNWNSSTSRTTRESKDISARPALAEECPDLSDFETIYIGFPIWWYHAPKIIHSFLESSNFTGKKIILFAPSGGSSMGDTLSFLKPSAPGAAFKGGKVWNVRATKIELWKWASELLAR